MGHTVRRALPQWFEPLTVGTLELTQAGSGPGAVISGVFSGRLGEEIGPLPPRMLPPVGGQYEDGELELRFETAWGSNRNANPFEEGQVTYFWRMNGVGNIRSTEGLAATAGHASPEEIAGFGIENAASVTILGVGAEGSIERLDPGAATGATDLGRIDNYRPRRLRRGVADARRGHCAGADCPCR